MSGIDENGNEIHYDGYFASGSHLNPDSLKDALNTVPTHNMVDGSIPCISTNIK